MNFTSATICIVMLMLLGGCAPYRLTVVDESGTPLVGTRVFIRERTFADKPQDTDQHGQVGLWISPSPQEHAWLVISKPDYGTIWVPWPEQWPATVTLPRNEHEYKSAPPLSPSVPQWPTVPMQQPVDSVP